MNDTVRPTEPDAQSSFLSIPARFRRVVSCHSDRTAINTSDAQWTYAELDERSTSLACDILNRVGTADPVVGLLLEHGTALVAAILGTLKAGRIYLALDPNDSVATLTAMLVDAQIGLLVTDKSNASLARSLATERLKVLVIEEEQTRCLPGTTCEEVPADAGAWLMYTSGSTGAPKGVWQSHGNVVHHAEVYRDLIGLTEKDRLSLITPFGLAASATPLFASLLNGAALCLYPIRSGGIDRLAEWMRNQRVTVYQSVPTVFRHLMRATGEGSLDSLRLIRLGGESVRPSDIEAYRKRCASDCALMNALSSTETGLISALLIHRDSVLREGPVPVGHPVGDVEVQLVDDQGRPVPRGAEGLMAVRSRYLAQGYWRRPDKTMTSFRCDPEEPQKRCFITADVGRIGDDGCLEHLGRADHQVKIRGRRVDLAEVEAAIQATKLADDVAAMATEHSSADTRLVAYVVPRSGVRLSTRTLRRMLRQSLSSHMIPDDFVCLPQLPVTPGGKVDRLALSALARPKEDHKRRGPMPRDRIEKALAVVWESVLNVSPIGRHDDFFDLGGTSLQSMTLLTRIEDKFDIVLSPSILSQHGTIESLAEIIVNRAVVPSPRSLVLLRPSTTGRPLFLVHTGAGYIAMYGQLAKRLSDRPVYALQARGLQGESWPLMSIPAMARQYVREITDVDPTGPYLLGGTCMGGLIAFEMARQLVEQGLPVALVALLESDYPARKGRRLRRKERMVSPVREAFRMLRWSVIRGLGLGRSARWLPTYRSFIGHMHARARRAYRPGFYCGKLTLFMAAERQYPGEDLRLRMARHARESHTVMIPGDRPGLLLPPAVSEVARQLQLCLDAAEAEGSP